MSPEQLETWPVASPVTARFWRIFYGRAFVEAVFGGDYETADMAQACREEWEP